MSSHAGWAKANTFAGDPCPRRGCKGKLNALYQLTVSAPYPFDAIGFTKSTIKSKQIGIVACQWELAHPFCPVCQWHSENTRESTKNEAIIRLMRALVMRGVAPSEVQRIVGDAVSVIDVLAATHPEID
ncbi:MAG TPA: hypothetical protein VFH61_04000 [Thermoleophilia bacterium]|nr:hypothetical protein [Thermoleophilia bacterium]